MKSNKNLSELSALSGCNWSYVKLGDAVDKVSTTGIKLKQKEYLLKGKYPVVDQGQELVGGYSNDGSLVVKTELPIVVFGDHTKVKKFIDFKFIAGADGVIIIKPKKEFFPKLFFYFLHCIQFPDKGYARHFQYVEKENIPLPPLPEQKKIVEKIEELFSGLDNGVASLKKAKEQIRLYRQSVLASAFSGRLHQDSSDYKINRIKEKNKSGKFLNPANPQILVNHGSDNLPDGWKWVKLGDVTNNFDGQRIPLSKEVRSKRKGDYRYYGATEIIDFIDEYIFDGTYLLIGEDGANLVSKSRPLSFLVEGKFWVNNHAHVLQTKGELKIKYLDYYFNSITLEPYVTGSAQPKLNQMNLNKIPVPLAPDNQQIQIVEEIEKRFSEADNLEKAIGDSLAKSETLRQSILKQAFEGKLV